MMMSATCKKIFSPIQIPEKVFYFWQNLILEKKMSKMGIFFKMFLVVTVKIYLGVKGQIVQSNYRKKIFFFFAELKVPIFYVKMCNSNLNNR